MLIERDNAFGEISFDLGRRSDSDEDLNIFRFSLCLLVGFCHHLIQYIIIFICRQSSSQFQLNLLLWKNAFKIFKDLNNIVRQESLNQKSLLISVQYLLIIQEVKDREKMYNPQQYIEWYDLLADEEHSREANMSLVKLENSEESWSIAKELIISQNPNWAKHGAQLLSKKLNRPYTSEKESTLQLQKFIMGLPQLNNLLYYCLSKIHLHLGYQEIHLMPPHNQIKDLLNILKGIPDATRVVTIPLSELSEKDTERSRAEKIFQSHKGIIIQNLGNQAYSEVIMQCIQSLVNNEFRLNSPELVRFLFTLPITETYLLLQEILLCEKYPILNQQTLNYLLKTSDDDLQYFYPVFVAFARSLPLLSLPVDLLKGILAKLLQTMRKDFVETQKTNYIIDSIQLWMELSNAISEKRKTQDSGEEEGELKDYSLKDYEEQNQEAISICFHAFIEVWKILLQKAVFSRIPQFRQQNSDPLAISANLSDELITSRNRLSEQCYSTEKFRDKAGDLLIVCYNLLGKQEEFKSAPLKYIYDLACSQDPCRLELAIYALGTILEYSRRSSIEEIGQILDAITNSSYATEPYMWQQLLKLLGMMSPETMTSPKIIQKALIVLEKSIQINELSALACEALISLIETCNASEAKKQNSQILDHFFSAIINNVYFPVCFQDPSKLNILDKLTKSFVLFISYFKTPEHLYSFLIRVQNFISHLATPAAICDFLYTLTLSQLYVREEYSVKNVEILSSFCVNYADLLLRQVIQTSVENKQDLRKGLSVIGTIVGALGGYNSSVWGQGLLRILSLPEKNKKIGSSYILPMIKFLTIKNSNIGYFGVAKEFIDQAEPIISSMLRQAMEKDYETIQGCLNFHFELIRLHSDKLTKEYNMDFLLNYICKKIIRDKQFYQYNCLKFSLGILRVVISKGYQPQAILEEIMATYSRLAEKFWKSLEAILFEAFKVGGREIYERTLRNISSRLLPPNPLFEVLISGFENQDGKTIKNILIHLD